MTDTTSRTMKSLRKGRKRKRGKESEYSPAGGKSNKINLLTASAWSVHVGRKERKKRRLLQRSSENGKDRGTPTTIGGRQPEKGKGGSPGVHGRKEKKKFRSAGSTKKRLSLSAQFPSARFPCAKAGVGSIAEKEKKGLRIALPGARRRRAVWEKESRHECRKKTCSPPNRVKNGRGRPRST